MSSVLVATLAASLAALAGVFVRRRLRGHGRGPPADEAASGVLSAALARDDLAGSAGTRAGLRTPLLVGAAMMLGSIPVGVALLRIEPAPTAEPAGVGLVPPVRGPEGNGFAIAVATTVRSCDAPVDVRLVAGGTAEYWRATGERASRTWRRFALVLPGTRLDALHVGMSENAPDITLPMHARLSRPDYLEKVRVRRMAGSTVVSGWVFAWTKHLNSIVVTFSADWLEPRGIGLCYLKLPALTGGLSVLAAQEAKGKVGTIAEAAGERVPLVITSDRTRRSAPYDRGLETTLATSTVLGDGADVKAESSLPAPDQTFQGHPTWVCETSRPIVRGLDHIPRTAVADIERGTSSAGAAYGRAYLKERRGEDCSAVVAIAEADSGVIRDGLLVVLGAVFSLGAAIFVETLLDRRAAFRRLA